MLLENGPSLHVVVMNLFFSSWTFDKIIMTQANIFVMLSVRNEKWKSLNMTAIKIPCWDVQLKCVKLYKTQADSKLVTVLRMIHINNDNKMSVKLKKQTTQLPVSKSKRRNIVVYLLGAIVRYSYVRYSKHGSLSIHRMFHCIVQPM